MSGGGRLYGRIATCEVCQHYGDALTCENYRRCKGARCGLCFPVLLLEEKYKPTHDHLNRWTYLCESCNSGVHHLVNLDAGVQRVGTAAAQRATPAKKDGKVRRAVLQDNGDEDDSGVEDKPLFARMPQTGKAKLTLKKLKLAASSSEPLNKQHGAQAAARNEVQRSQQQREQQPLQPQKPQKQQLQQPRTEGQHKRRLEQQEEPPHKKRPEQQQEQARQQAGETQQQGGQQEREKKQRLAEQEAARQKQLQEEERRRRKLEEEQRTRQQQEEETQKRQRKEERRKQQQQEEEERRKQQQQEEEWQKRQQQQHQEEERRKQQQMQQPNLGKAQGAGQHGQAKPPATAARHGNGTLERRPSSAAAAAAASLKRAGSDAAVGGAGSSDGTAGAAGGQAADAGAGAAGLQNRIKRLESFQEERRKERQKQQARESKQQQQHQQQHADHSGPLNLPSGLKIPEHGAPPAAAEQQQQQQPAYGANHDSAMAMLVGAGATGALLHQESLDFGPHGVFGAPGRRQKLWEGEATLTYDQDSPDLNIKLYFEMVPGLEPSPQLQQLSARGANDPITATHCTRINMTTSVVQAMGAGMAPSRHYRCRVMERNNFRKNTCDLPRVIQSLRSRSSYLAIIPSGGASKVYLGCVWQNEGTVAQWGKGDPPAGTDTIKPDELAVVEFFNQRAGPDERPRPALRPALHHGGSGGGGHGWDAGHGAAAAAGGGDGLAPPTFGSMGLDDGYDFGFVEAALPAGAGAGPAPAPAPLDPAAGGGGFGGGGGGGGVFGGGFMADDDDDGGFGDFRTHDVFGGGLGMGSGADFGGMGLGLGAGMVLPAQPQEPGQQQEQQPEQQPRLKQQPLPQQQLKPEQQPPSKRAPLPMQRPPHQQQQPPPMQQPQPRQQQQATVPPPPPPPQLQQQQTSKSGADGLGRIPRAGATGTAGGSGGSSASQQQVPRAPAVDGLLKGSLDPRLEAKKRKVASSDDPSVAAQGPPPPPPQQQQQQHVNGSAQGYSYQPSLQPPLPAQPPLPVQAPPLPSERPPLPGQPPLPGFSGAGPLLQTAGSAHCPQQHGLTSVGDVLQRYPGPRPALLMPSSKDVCSRGFAGLRIHVHIQTKTIHELAPAVEWVRQQGAHVTRTDPLDPSSVPAAGSVDVLVLDPGERAQRGMEGNALSIKEHLVAGVSVVGQAVLAPVRAGLAPGPGAARARGGSPGFLSDCMAKRRLSRTAMDRNAFAQTGVLLLADELLLHVCPRHKVVALVAALASARKRNPPPPAADPAAAAAASARCWGVGLRAQALAAAPPHLRDVALAPPFRALGPDEVSRSKPGCHIPELVRDAVKAWHTSKELRFSIVVTPDLDDVAGDAALARRAAEVHGSARSQRTVLSGGVSEVTELLRVLAGELVP